MQILVRTVSGLAACVVGLLLSCPQAIGGFELRIDGTTLREVQSGSYEIDAFLNLTPAGTPATIQSVLLNLSIAPANGFSLEDISGVQFDGLRNPDSNTLFANPSVVSQIFSPLAMAGSLTSSSPITTPETSKLAFTVLFSTTRGSASDVQIKFEEVGNFYEIDRDNEGSPKEFAGLVSSPAITVVKVPEPAACILAMLGFGGIGIARRFSKRSSRKVG